MSNKYVVTEKLQEVFAHQLSLPTTVLWNRLEGRPRRKDFARALKAEVRDPLWMITRQWQFGEFLAEDAGSPVSAKVAWKSDPLTELHAPGGAEIPYDPELPLEAMVEALPVPLTLAGRLHNADLRLTLGRRWRQLLDANGHGSLFNTFRGEYTFAAPDPDVESDFPITAHAGAWQTIAAAAGRAMDGGALLLHLIDGGLASDAMNLVDPQKTQIDNLGTEFVTWAQSLFYDPGEELRAWLPRNLEYATRLSAPKGEEKAAIAAPEYRGGRLDWFSFDAVPPRDSDEPGVAHTPEVTSFFPATIQFEGMPNTRHWTFEEGAVNFGNIDVDTTDIAKLLLIEFGLIYANDWFLLPIDLQAGSLTSIEGLAVTNVFGERFWITPAVTAAGPVQSWNMFKLTNKGAADDRLFIPATTPATLESAPVETAMYIRDEISNMVWGIESVVQLPDGSSRRGREVALELHAKHQAAVPAPPDLPPANDAKIRYVLMTSVAEHWIPFVPVHIENDNREIQLQRAAMPRLLEGAEGITPDKIPPRTRIVREGLDLGTPQPYFIAEEEVERAGTIIETRWQRCRWRNGQVITWLGHHRTTGRGEGSAGLAFDVVRPKR